MLVKAITYFGQPAIVACDGRCDKAWGINGRPTVSLGDDPNDFAYLADKELEEAPADPGTYEGGHAKPTCASSRLNKWCVRACERSCMTKPEGLELQTRDFSKRFFNQPWKHAAE